MKQLSGLDATFLYLETPQMPMHVGALHVLELPAGAKAVSSSRLRKHMAERLPVAPVLRRRLWWMPLNMANPAWVDAVPDLREHIVEIRLPAGAGIAELEAQVSRCTPCCSTANARCGRCMSSRAWRPGRTAGGVSRCTRNCTTPPSTGRLRWRWPTPAGPDATAARHRAACVQAAAVFRLEMTEMLRGVIGNQAQKVAQIVRELPATVGTLKGAAGKALSQTTLLGGAEGRVSNLTLAPRTPLNASVTAGRAFATVTLPLGASEGAGAGARAPPSTTWC
jgi:diacylglycerol O-acyltransferase / wax synthase